MKAQPAISGYRYMSSGHSHAHAYLLPTVKAELSLKKKALGKQPARLFDLGCGNGSVAAQIAGGGGMVSHRRRSFLRGDCASPASLPRTAAGAGLGLRRSRGEIWPLSGRCEP